MDMATIVSVVAAFIIGMTTGGVLAVRAEGFRSWVRPKGRGEG